MMCIQAHYSSPLTAFVCKPSRDKLSLVTWVSASPDFPVPHLQNLTFSQWTGVQQLLFLLKTHFSAARKPAHLSPAMMHLLLVFLSSQKHLDLITATVTVSFNVAKARWCATKGGSNSTCLKRSLEQKWVTKIWGNCKQLTAYAPYLRCKL